MASREEGVEQRTKADVSSFGGSSLSPVRTEANETSNCRDDRIVSDEQNAFKCAYLHNEPRMAFTALILIFVDISHRHCQPLQAVIQLNYKETHCFFHMVSLLRVELHWKNLQGNA